MYNKLFLTLVEYMGVFTGECITGRHPLTAGQLLVGGGGIGRLCGVCSGPAEHQALPSLPQPVYNSRHSGLQCPRERLLHGAAEW